MTEHSPNSPEVSSSSDYTSAPTEGLKTLDQLHDGKPELKQEGQSEQPEAITPPAATASPATGASLPTTPPTTQTSTPSTVQPVAQTSPAPGTQPPAGK